MGYYSNMAIKEDLDREELNKREEIIKVILKVYPEKKREINFMSDESLRGLYGTALQKIRSELKKIRNGIDYENIERRSR